MLSVNFALSSVNPPTSSPLRIICGTVRAVGIASSNSSRVYPSPILRSSKAMPFCFNSALA